MAEHTKSLTDQVDEIARLVYDVQERLDQVVRALGTLRERAVTNAVDGAAR